MNTAPNNLYEKRNPGRGENGERTPCRKGTVECALLDDPPFTWWLVEFYHLWKVKISVMYHHAKLGGKGDSEKNKKVGFASFPV